jgi:hypothetical protein
MYTTCVALFTIYFNGTEVPNGTITACYWVLSAIVHSSYKSNGTPVDERYTL